MRALIKDAEAGADAYSFGEEVPEFLIKDIETGKGRKVPKWDTVGEGVEGTSGERNKEGTVVRDAAQGVTLRRMSNGVCFAHKRTQYDKGQVLLHPFYRITTTSSSFEVMWSRYLYFTLHAAEWPCRCTCTSHRRVGGVSKELKGWGERRQRLAPSAFRPCVKVASGRTRPRSLQSDTAPCP